jgi:hypothetical protein
LTTDIEKSLNLSKTKKYWLRIWFCVFIWFFGTKRGSKTYRDKKEVKA